VNLYILATYLHLAEHLATFLLAGVQQGHAHITSDFITDLFRTSTRGVTPKQNWLKDALLDMVAYVR
jgi:3-dehydrosphinganine reductase